MAYTAGPFDQAHLYLQWGGKLPGAEQWSCGLRMYGPAATAVADAGTLMDDVVPVVQSFHTRQATGIHANAKLSFVKLNAIGTNGNYIEQSTNETVLADIAGGGGPAFAKPNQVCQVVSLLTGFSRGPAHRGRFYLPLPIWEVDDTGRISTGEAANCSDSADTFVTALNATNANWKVGVFSRKLGAAGHRAVIGTQVGRVLDTQRRRRRSLVEDYR
jgi:hypothetical protein